MKTTSYLILYLYRSLSVWAEVFLSPREDLFKIAFRFRTLDRHALVPKRTCEKYGGPNRLFVICAITVYFPGQYVYGFLCGLCSSLCSLCS